MTGLPQRVRINEEGPREGFQIEGAGIPTARKIELIDSLSQTGLQQIQIASFVNPKRVPGMADAAEVVAGVQRRPGVRYTALWLNDQGFRRALATGRLDLMGRVVLCASPAFLLRNQNMTLQDNLQSHREQIKTYLDNGVPVEHGGMQAAFGCNFEGDIPVQQVLDISADAFRLAEEFGLRLKTFTLADTMAWANPSSVRRMVEAFQQRFAGVEIILHLHDTRGLGLANALAGLQSGVSNFDASAAGLGGCPFAAHQGAAGNLCTEDFVFMCQEMGIETGIDLDKLIESAQLAEAIVGHPLPGSVQRGGNLKALREARSAQSTLGGRAR
ncbi:MAG TPA: hydroxymethylglutaryl-CoA lyase [Burkholderiaceae bacterium]|jgi:hydroxymethylglutaryl-CoA lyase